MWWRTKNSNNRNTKIKNVGGDYVGGDKIGLNEKETVGLVGEKLDEKLGHIQNQIAELGDDLKNAQAAPSTNYVNAVQATTVPTSDYPILENYDKDEFEIDGTVLKKYKGNKADVKIPYGVTIIDRRAFTGCASVICLTIPESVTYIDSWTFEQSTHIMFKGAGNLTNIIYKGTYRKWKAIKKGDDWARGKVLIVSCTDKVKKLDFRSLFE